MYSFYWLISLFPFLWIRKWPPFVSEWKKSGLQTHSLRTIEWGNPWSQLGLVTEHQQQWLEMIPYQEANFDLPQAGAHRRACPGGRWGPSSKSQGTQSWRGRNTGQKGWPSTCVAATCNSRHRRSSSKTQAEARPTGRSSLWACCELRYVCDDGRPPHRAVELLELDQPKRDVF